MFKTFDNISVKIIEDDINTTFILYNENKDIWEWVFQKYNNTEYNIPDPKAIGLIFPKTSSKAMAQALRCIADQLDK